MTRIDRMIASAVATPGPNASNPPWMARRTSVRWYALAASLLIAVTAGISIWSAREREALYLEVTQHADGERKVMVVSDKRVPPDKTASRFARTSTRLTRELPLSIVRVCKIRGVEIPHLIMQTPEGPVHVMVLSKEHMLMSHSFEELGYQGVMVPDRGQLIAVVGATRAAVTQGAALAKGAFELQQ
jgi:hypothetical protein